MATGDGNTYTLKGDQPVRQVMKLDEDVSFKAPWGEDMHIKKGGVLVYNDPGDIYGIQPEEFKSTYSFVGDANNIKSAGATIEADATPSHADYVKEYGEPGTMPGKKGIDASYEDYERAYNEGRFEEAARMRRPASSIPSHADYVAEYGEPGAMPETATVEKAFRESRITTSGAEAVADAAKYAGDAKYLEGVEGAARRMHGGLIVNAVVGAGVGILTYNATGSLAESGEASLAAIVPYAQTAEQLAAGDTKGAVKSAMTETAGIAGAIAGASSGAAIGATIGSIVPVVGTVIGGAVGGIVGGVVGGVAAGFGTDFLLTEVPEIVDTVHDGIKSGLNYVGITDDDLHDAYTQTMDVVHDVGDTIGEAYAATAAVASDVSDSIDAAYRETEDAAASAYNAVADTASSGWKTLTSLFNSEAEPETMVAEATHEAEKTAGADMPMDDAADVEMTWEKAHTALPGEIDPEMPPEVQSLVAVKVSKELFQRQFSELEEHGGLTEVSAYIEKNPVPAEVRSTQQQDMANDIAVRNETMARQNNSSMSLG